MPAPASPTAAAIAALATHLAELRQGPCPPYLSPPEWHYALQLWEYLVIHHQQAGATAEPAYVDALPYLPPAALAAHGQLTAHSIVLDAGCLSGYGLGDLVLRQRLAGRPCPRLLALDINRSYLTVLQHLAAYWRQDVPLLVLHGDLTALPLQRAAVDLLLARLILPYVSLPLALAEIARVVRPGGSVLLQLHDSGYYRLQAWRERAQPRRCAYYLRPLASGLWFRLTGRQPRHRLFAETAMGIATLARAAAPYGLTLRWQGPPALKPLLLLRRT